MSLRKFRWIESKQRNTLAIAELDIEQRFWIIFIFDLNGWLNFILIWLLLLHNDDGITMRIKYVRNLLFFLFCPFLLVNCHLLLVESLQFSYLLYVEICSSEDNHRENNDYEYIIPKGAANVFSKDSLQKHCANRNYTIKQGKCKRWRK